MHARVTVTDRSSALLGVITKQLRDRHGTGLFITGQIELATMRDETVKLTTHVLNGEQESLHGVHSVCVQRPMSQALCRRGTYPRVVRSGLGRTDAYHYLEARPVA